MSDTQKEYVSKEQAVREVRMMAYQFAEMYFAFVQELRGRYGEDTAKDIAERVLYIRAKERAHVMVKRAEETGKQRAPENIGPLGDVPFLGWTAEQGEVMCPYAKVWIERSEEYPWFRPFAELYCSVTDKTICEIFTGSHSLAHTKNVIRGDDQCKIDYFPSDAATAGRLTYGYLDKSV